MNARGAWDVLLRGKYIGIEINHFLSFSSQISRGDPAGIGVDFEALDFIFSSALRHEDEMIFNIVVEGFKSTKAAAD